MVTIDDMFFVVNYFKNEYIKTLDFKDKLADYIIEAWEINPKSFPRMHFEWKRAFYVISLKFFLEYTFKTPFNIYFVGDLVDQYVPIL